MNAVTSGIRTYDQEIKCLLLMALGATAERTGLEPAPHRTSLFHGGNTGTNPVGEAI